jgi:prepilin-type N-terminal cleavage/methylation domain-containing protein
MEIKNNKGFTIVELLVVIVVIGILAAITIVAYSGITNRANTASIQSDLANASQQLKMYYTTYGYYPTAFNGSNCPSNPTLDTSYCIKLSSGNSYSYNSVLTTSAPSTFHLTVTNTSNNISYSITDTTSPTIATYSPTTTTPSTQAGLACPTGFIAVPGSGTYGTSDFCVMKYEAKADDNNDGIGDTTQSTGSNTWPADTYPISSTRKLVSTSAGYPVANISQTTAITAASSYTANCTTGCHLITEAEWMTIAQNVLSVPSNWSGSTVGNGSISRGNSNTSAAMDGSTDLTGVNKRTLTLTNGEIVWDLSGNVWEWTSGVTNGTTAQQPGVAGNNYASWIEWPNITTPGTLSPNVFPSGTGISGASSWTSSNGVGQLLSNPAETSLHGFPRGGSWSYGGDAGVLALSLSDSPSRTTTFVGFRVSR